MNDTVVSPEPGTEVAEYSATEHGLAELRKRLGGRVYDVGSTKGLEEARKDRAELRGLRVALEAQRKELKAPLLARGKLLDDEAKRITAEIAALEDPIDVQIKAEEARKEEARKERERAEAARLATINAQLDNLRAIPLNAIGATAEELQQAMDNLAADTLERFDEVHLPTAQMIKDGALTVLRRMLAEREDLDRQRAELERQAQEQAEREAEAAAQREREEAERREQQEREDAERRRLQAEEDQRRAAEAEAARVEQERVAAEQAERQRQLDEQAAAQRAAQEEAEAKARVERERFEAEQRRREGMLYVIAMPDGSRWAVPLMMIARNRAEHYAKEFDGDVERSLAEDTLPLFEANPFEAHDWAGNNMNWSDVESEARIYAPAKPMTRDDFLEGWVNGAYEVIIPEPRA